MRKPLHQLIPPALPDAVAGPQPFRSRVSRGGRDGCTVVSEAEQRPGVERGFRRRTCDRYIEDFESRNWPSWRPLLEAKRGEGNEVRMHGLSVSGERYPETLRRTKRRSGGDRWMSGR